jgi:hypothetical protein
MCTRNSKDSKHEFQPCSLLFTFHTEAILSELIKHGSLSRLTSPCCLPKQGDDKDLTEDCHSIKPTAKCHSDTKILASSAQLSSNTAVLYAKPAHVCPPTFTIISRMDRLETRIATRQSVLHTHTETILSECSTHTSFNEETKQQSNGPAEPSDEQNRIDEWNKMKF